MKKLFLFMAIATMLAACSSNGKPIDLSFNSTVCSGPVRGFTVTGVGYGDSKIVVLPVSKVRANTEFRIRLIPERRPKTDLVDYETVDVTVMGKPGPSAWISGNGNYNGASAHWIPVGCVPASAAIGTVYEFTVEVAGVGWIDPRADVVQ